MVEAIEDLFVPVLVYNNKPEDEGILKSFDEPSWNNPVVRFLDQNRRDLIERKNAVWETPDLAGRMAQALEAAGQSVPTYLRLIAEDHTLAVDLVFDPAKVSYRQLVQSAQQLDCTSAVFARDDEQWSVASELVSDKARRVPPDFDPRLAQDPDQQYYLQHSPYASLTLSPLQSTRINGLLGEGQDRHAAIWSLLSSRQLKAFEIKTSPTR